MQTIYQYTESLQGYAGAGFGLDSAAMYTSVRAPATLVPASVTVAGNEQQQCHLHNSRSETDPESDSDSQSDIARVQEEDADTLDERWQHQHAAGQDRPSLLRDGELDLSDYPTLVAAQRDHSLVTYVYESDVFQSDIQVSLLVEDMPFLRTSKSTCMHFLIVQSNLNSIIRVLYSNWLKRYPS